MMISKISKRFYRTQRNILLNPNSPTFYNGILMKDRPHNFSEIGPSIKRYILTATGKNIKPKEGFPKVSQSAICVFNKKTKKNYFILQRDMEFFREPTFEHIHITRHLQLVFAIHLKNLYIHENTEDWAGWSVMDREVRLRSGTVNDNSENNRNMSEEDAMIILSSIPKKHCLKKPFENAVQAL